MALALSHLPPVSDERVLVGTGTADDAGVFQIAPDRALVHTVDLLAPVVDDPYTFGQIAAINCLSDVYAMGGEPFAALNVMGYPPEMGPDILSEILHGGQDAAQKAGTVVLGGHTFQSDEIRYGLAVTGEISPDEIYTNAGAQVGELLVLTKPLGTGTVINTLISRGAAPAGLYQATVDSMTTSNRSASLAMRRVKAHACTDITGFGFLGHTWEVASASNVGINIHTSQIPTFNNVLNLIRDGIIDGSHKMNRNSFDENVIFAEDISAEEQILLYSSETSGGLLIAVPEEKVQSLLDDLHSNGLEAASVVGEVVDEHHGSIKVLK